MSTRYSRDAAAVCYSQLSVYQNDRGMKLLEKLPPNPDSQILDLGCGTGYLANALAERVGPKGKVVAVDPDDERIKVARESYSSNNLKFLVASDKDFPEGEYDLVLSNFVFHWIENKDAAFRRVYRNLKPGGRFGFTTKDNPTTPDVITQVVHLFGPETVKATLGSLHWGSAEDYESLASSCGFEVARMEVRERSYTFPNIDSLIDYLYGGFHGKFDHSSAVLDDLKKQYEGQSITVVAPELTTILTKPLYSNRESGGTSWQC